MVIEHLTLHIPLALRQRFLKADGEVWTATLAARPGFLGKETWADATDPETLHLIIRWQTRAAWKAVPAALLNEANARMTAAMGQPCPVLTCTDLDVLDPHQRHPGPPAA
ncbi:TIGR03792 family protein [Tabrizicola sp.]|uniref:TIGR03792 family protein n=1 Tax=Tabrizicola sp. TaxID=2005166 RepID=UPI00286D597D|nr:TIGR03792 family protein [Tabrizicola sp.]